MWWVLCGLCLLGFWGRIVINLWVSYNISVLESWGGGCSKLLMKCVGVCVNFSYSQCVLDDGMVVT